MNFYHPWMTSHSGHRRVPRFNIATFQTIRQEVVKKLMSAPFSSYTTHSSQNTLRRQPRLTC